MKEQTKANIVFMVATLVILAVVATRLAYKDEPRAYPTFNKGQEVLVEGCAEFHDARVVAQTETTVLVKGTISDGGFACSGIEWERTIELSKDSGRIKFK